MGKIDYGELVFVTLGYFCFVWFYYKLAKKWSKKVNDKYMVFYICTMLVLPAGMVAIMILQWLYSTIFGGV